MERKTQKSTDLGFYKKNADDEKVIYLALVEDYNVTMTYNMY